MLVQSTLENLLMKKLSLPRLLVGIAFYLAMPIMPAEVQAEIVTQWNFNTVIGVNNSPLPSTGVGSATPVGMNGGLNNADILAAGGTPTSTDPAATNNNAWRVRGSTNNGWSGTTQLLSGAQFNVSTAGFNNIVTSFDVNATNGSARYAQFQYTLDGSSFTSFAPLIDFNAFNDRWAPSFSFDLSSISGANNNPLFGFKLVSAFSPVEFTNSSGLQAANTAFQRSDAAMGVYNGTAGNWRFDMVTVTSVPEPATFSLVAVGTLGIALVCTRRKSKHLPTRKPNSI